jgi:hypothetical protein
MQARRMEEFPDVVPFHMKSWHDASSTHSFVKVCARCPSFPVEALAWWNESVSCLSLWGLPDVGT